MYGFILVNTVTIGFSDNHGHDANTITVIRTCELARYSHINAETCNNKDHLLRIYKMTNCTQPLFGT